MQKVNAQGAVAALQRVIRAVEELGRLPKKLAVASATPITNLLHEEFDKGQDPYGRPWKPLAKSTIRRGRRPPPLSKTKTLRNNTKAVPMRGSRIGLTLVVGAPYGIFHQESKNQKRLPRREFLPTRGMPQSWRKVLDTQAKRIADQAFAGVT